MKITISFKHLEHTPALDAKIREKSEHLAKYLDGNTTIKWTCSVKEGASGEHVAELHVHGPKCDFHATAHSDNLYKCLDLAVEKVEKQMSKKKEKWKNHLHHKDNQLEIRDPEAAWLSYDGSWNDYKKVV